MRRKVALKAEEIARAKRARLSMGSASLVFHDGDQAGTCCKGLPDTRPPKGLVVGIVTTNGACITGLLHGL